MTNQFPWQPDATSAMSTVACVNVGGGLDLYFSGYRRTAEIIMLALESDQGEQDFLVYPLGYCLRHAIELALKSVTASAHRLFDEPDGFVDGHRLEDLWRTARPLLERVWTDDPEAMGQISRVIGDIQRIDPTGVTFRYPVSAKKGKGPSHRAPTLDRDLRHIDMSQLYADVSEALDLLDGAATGLSVYRDHKTEADAMRREMNAEYAEEMREEARDYWESDE